MHFKNISTLLVAGVLSASALTVANAESKTGSNSYDNFAVKLRVGVLHENGKLEFGNTSAKLHKKTTPNLEVASNYFFTKNVAAELALGYHALKESSGSNSKTFSFIPLTGTVQYHFMPDAGFSPYVGAGYGYSFVAGKGNTLNIKSAGSPVVQAGFDVPMSNSMLVNVDAKYGFARKHNASIGSTSGKFKSKPLSVMAGVGFTF